MNPPQSALQSNNPTETVSAGLQLEEYWQEHIRCWEQSGLSQSAYCQREGLIVHRWHYWHKKLTRGGVKPSGKQSELIPVKVIEQPLTQELTVTLPNGVRIDGVNTQTVSLLSALLKQL